MSKLLINATKNYGGKILTALNENAISNFIEGVYVSLADMPKKQLEKLVNEVGDKTRIMYDFPIYFILDDNLYITQNKLENNLSLQGRRNNKSNKLECLMENVNFSSFADFPLQPSSYVQNRSYIDEVITRFYEVYYGNSDEILLPTFILKDLNSWKEILIEDTFSSAQKYAETNNKQMICSFIIDFSYLDKEDVAQRIQRYFERYSKFKSVSITLTIDRVGTNSYTSQQYLAYMRFVDDLTSRRIKVRIQNAGLKDVILSIFDVESFSVGWSSTYRGMNLEQRKITSKEYTSFGKKTKKVFLSSLMSEVPLSYFDVFTLQENSVFFGDQFKGMHIVSYNWIEQKYWIEFVKVISLVKSANSIVDGKIISSNIASKINLLEDAFDSAKSNLNLIIERLNQKGRYTDANKLRNDQLRCIINNKDALVEYKNNIFDF